jgi:hypothetical protein
VLLQLCFKQRVEQTRALLHILVKKPTRTSRCLVFVLSIQESFHKCSQKSYCFSKHMCKTKSKATRFLLSSKEKSIKPHTFSTTTAIKNTCADRSMVKHSFSPHKCRQQLWRKHVLTKNRFLSSPIPPTYTACELLAFLMLQSPQKRLVLFFFLGFPPFFEKV